MAQRIERQVRSHYNVPPQVKVVLSPLKPSEFPNYDALTVTFDNGEKKQAFDFLLSRDGLLYLSEINTIPGFTPISLFPLLCARGGYDFGGICERIVGLALERAAVAPMRRLTRTDLP